MCVLFIQALIALNLQVVDVKVLQQEARRIRGMKGYQAACVGEGCPGRKMGG